MSGLLTSSAYRLLSVLPNGALYGASFRRSRRLRAAFHASSDPQGFVAAFQRRALARLFEVAQRSAFYRRETARTELAQFGFIDKDTVLEHAQEMLLNKASADLVTTGGTSGKPLAFYINKNRKGAEWYWMTAGWSEVGFELGSSWRAVLRNHALRGKVYVENPLMREVCFDNFRLNDAYMAQITDVIKNRQLSFIHAYPSAAYTLANYWHEHGNKPGCVKAFLCGSENVFSFQRELIQQTLGIRMLTWFGHSEKLILAHEKASCEHLHSNPFYGITELIGEDGLTVREPGQFGELVGTGFINTCMPFIRYRTGDFAEYVGETCPSCGHVGATFKNVRGRWSGDKVYLSNGEVVTTTALNLHDEIYRKLNGLQYHQHVKGALEIWVIPGEGWDERSERELVAHLKVKVPLALDFAVKLVDQLAYGKNRKYQLLVQSVKA